MENPSFNDIKEATLWDELKRRANRTLRKIESIEDVKKRLDQFEKPRFELIQVLLRNLGKDFFRIFLYKAIKEDMKLYQDEFILNKTVQNFQFYFWPGYTSLKGQRIFIEGARREPNGIEKYFSGIGNKPMPEYDEKTILRYFTDSKNALFPKNDGTKDFWVYNIPSTLAFDRVMNQYYLDREFKGLKRKYIPGSMHHWKSAQLSLQWQKPGGHLDMELSGDKSELRIITVKAVGIGDETKVTTGENQLIIPVRCDELAIAGDIISKCLNPKKIPLDISADQRSNMIQWPSTGLECEGAIDQESMFRLQTAGYSYWIAETLDNRTGTNLNYKHIRKKFRDTGLDDLANRIVPFSKDKNHIESDDEFFELYYKNWYTLFLEGHAQSSDLGSAMFLCNYDYLPGFLLKCSHWLRWIFNELRLIEAKTNAEYNTELRTFKVLKHTQRQYALAVLAGAEKLKEGNSPEHVEMVYFAASVINGHLEVIEHMDDLFQYVEKQRQDDGNFAPISLSSIVNSNISVFETILNSQPEVMHRCIKNILETERYPQIVVPLLKQLKLLTERLVHLPETIFSIIIKECLINMLENMDIEYPVLDLEVVNNPHDTSIILTNSISDFHLEHYAEVYRKLTIDRGIGNRLGWWVIKRLLDATRCRWKISTEEQLAKSKLFSLTITIPVYEQASDLNM